MDANIQVFDDILTVKDFKTVDKEIVSYFNEIPEEQRSERFEKALKVGVVALRTTGTTEKIDYIQKEFSDLETKFKSGLDKVKDELDKYFGDRGIINSLVTNSFGERGMVVRNISEIFDPYKTGSPIFNLRNLLEEKIKTVEQALQGLKTRKEVEAVIQKSIQKGYSFEDECERILSEVVKLQSDGDQLENTTKKEGKLKDCDKGDFVVALGKRTDKTFTFEVKDVQTISLPVIIDTLDTAMKNRTASYGIFIVKNISALPKSIGWFNEYGGNKLVCALSSELDNGQIHDEILHIAYKWCKTKLLLEVAESKGLDITKIQEKMSNLKGIFSNLRAIRLQCTNIDNSVKSLREESDTLEKIVKEQLEDIEKELRKSI
ncbi:MAG: hypothetical protein Q8O13_04310 [Candidatus Omnitrophota bacterium]|nr:hypothetical protein [Candidatus Omnitrophota bacterium]